MSGNYHIDLDRGPRRIGRYNVVDPCKVKPRYIKVKHTAFTFLTRPATPHELLRRAQRERLAHIAAELKL